MTRFIAHARAVLAACFVFAAAPALADGPGDAGPNVAAPPIRATPVQPTAEPAAAPQGQTGQVTLIDGELVLNVPTAYRFYSADEAQRFLQRTGQAAPNGNVLGLLAPANARVDQPGTWATVVSYEPIGYVSPDGAGALTDPNLETQVRDARTNQGRTFEGFAAQPAFDSAAGGLAWAERAGAPGGASGVDLRHEQRVLGRRGVAGLTSIGSADQMGAITAALPDMIGSVSFPEGARYADFEAASDPVSDASLTSLVTGVQPGTELVQAAASGAAQQQSGGSGLAGLFPWIAGGVVVLAGAGYLLMRRRRDPDLEPDVEEA
ncbi:MAG: DUF2167 domain-containing protein [Hyphomonadaceae bacterium]